MKTFFAVVLVAAGAFLSGCATGRSGLVLDTVGPVPAPAPALNTTNGTLVVYSAYDVNAEFNAPDPRRSEYSDYKILTADAKLLKRVHNNAGTLLQDAVPVTLPAGKYLVIARANGYEQITVPVIIEANHNTIVHLEGGGDWPDESGFDKTNTVRLPGGEIAGWKASLP